jgi:hypothetical protein
MAAYIQQRHEQLQSLQTNLYVQKQVGSYTTVRPVNGIMFTSHAAKVSCHIYEILLLQEK